MRRKGVFRSLRTVQLKYHTAMVELFLGYFASRELGSNACDVSVEGNMHEFEWTKNIHKVVHVCMRVRVRAFACVCACARTCVRAFVCVCFMM